MYLRCFMDESFDWKVPVQHLLYSLWRYISVQAQATFGLQALVMCSLPDVGRSVPFTDCFVVHVQHWSGNYWELSIMAYPWCITSIKFNRHESVGVARRVQNRTQQAQCWKKEWNFCVTLPEQSLFTCVYRICATGTPVVQWCWFRLHVA